MKNLYKPVLYLCKAASITLPAPAGRWNLFWHCGSLTDKQNNINSMGYSHQNVPMFGMTFPHVSKDTFCTINIDPATRVHCCHTTTDRCAFIKLKTAETNCMRQWHFLIINPTQFTWIYLSYNLFIPFILNRGVTSVSRLAEQQIPCH